MIFIRYLLITILLISIFNSCSNEPEPVSSNPTLNAAIKGKVLDIDTGEPIYYATIFTVPPTTRTQTGLTGEFMLNNIPPKDYLVYGYIPGFDSDSIFVSLHNGDTASVNLYLNNFSEYLDYYPLDIGNYWEYWSGDSPIFSAEIISDTMISGKIYRVVQEKSLVTQNIEYRYERVDEYNALVYRYFSSEKKEMIIDSLPAKVGQVFTSNMFYDPERICCSLCSYITEEQIFEDTMKVRSLYHVCATDLPRYQIVKGLGLYSTTFWRTGGYKLKYAIIKGVEYGEK